MRTRRYVASAISTDGIAHLGWLASELRSPDKALQSLHEQLVDVIPNRGQLESISRIAGGKRLERSRRLRRHAQCRLATDLPLQ